MIYSLGMRDQHDVESERAFLRAEIDRGLASGLVAGEAEEVLDAVMAEDPDFRPTSYLRDFGL